MGIHALACVSFWAPWASQGHMDAGLPPKLAWPVAITLPWSREVRIGFPAAVSISNSLYNTPSTLVQWTWPTRAYTSWRGQNQWGTKCATFCCRQSRSCRAWYPDGWSLWNANTRSWVDTQRHLQCQFSCLSTLRSVSQAAKATHAPYQCQT